MRWAVWAVYVGVLSLVLLTPQPADLVRAVAPGSQLPVTKGFHLAAFAGLAVLCGWLPLGPRGRWAMLGVLSLYAAGTEVGQTFVPGRTGSWQDVAIDHTGLFLGVAASFPWWRR